MKERRVVRRIKRAAMPSTPREYFAPRDGIQSCVSRKKKSPDLRKPANVQRGIDTRNSAPAKSVVTHRTTEVFSRGTKSTTSVPTTGRKIRSDRSGSPFIRRPSLQEEIETHEAENADGHRQRVVLGTAGLEAVHPAKRRLEHVPDAVHRAVHERAVEPRGHVGETEREAGGPVRNEVDDTGVNLPQESTAFLDETVHEDGLVELVHAVLVAHEAIEAAERGGDPRRDREGERPRVQTPAERDSEHGDEHGRPQEHPLRGMRQLVRLENEGGRQLHENRLEELLDRVLAAENELRNSQKARERGARRENVERHRHRSGRLVDVLELLGRPAERAEERHPHEAEHVEGRETRRQDRETPEAVSYTHLRAHETRHDLVC